MKLDLTAHLLSISPSSRMEARAAFRTFSPARLRGVASASAARSPRSPSLLLTSSRRTLPLHDRRYLTCAAPVGAGEKPRRRAYDGLLLDAGGTLLQLAPPVAQTYLSIGRKYGMMRTESEIKQGFKRAFAAPWTEKLRVTGARSGGMSLSRLPDAGTRAILKKCMRFDAIIVSSEIGYEKPDVKIFTAALEQINVKPDKALHVGDDEKNDKDGARAAGIDCLLWGSDVKTFADLYDVVLAEDP